MGTTTTNLGLYKPAVGETGWGASVNANFDKMDVAGLVHPAIRYVNAVGGSDSNSGATWGTAKATIQAGYDALSSIGGTVYIAPSATPDSGYNVGTGVECQGGKPAVFTSALGHRHQRTGITAYVDSVLNWGPRIYTTNSSANQLFNVTGAYGQGFGWIGLVFDASAAGLEQAIYTNATGYALVEDCTCVGPEAWAGQTYFIRSFVTPPDDGSYWRILNNVVRRTGLCYLGDTTGGANDRNYIAGNTCLGWATSDYPNGIAIRLEFPNGCQTHGNSLEQCNYGIWLHAAEECSFVGDAGEYVENFIYASSARGCTFIPSGAWKETYVNEKLVTVDSGNNVIIAATLDGNTVHYPASSSTSDAVNGGPDDYTLLYPATLFDSA